MILPAGSPLLASLARQESGLNIKLAPPAFSTGMPPQELVARAKSLVPPLGLSRGISLFAEPRRLPTGPVPASVIINERNRRERENEKGAQIPLYVPPPPPPAPRDIDGKEREGDGGEKRGYVDITNDGNIDFSI